MRTLRLALAATVILVLVGGLAGVAVAQSEIQAPVEAVHATGSTSASEISSPSITTLPNGATRITVTGHWVLTMDDPRFSGTETFIHTEDHYREIVGPVLGTTRLENEGGVWLGQYRGVILPDGSATNVGTYVGEGDYEGLSAACSLRSEGGGAIGDCILYPGPVPEFELPAGQSPRCSRTPSRKGPRCCHPAHERPCPPTWRMVATVRHVMPGHPPQWHQLRDVAGDVPALLGLAEGPAQERLQYERRLRWRHSDHLGVPVEE